VAMNETKMAQNFMDRYSKPQFVWLLKELTNGTSTTCIARKLGVTRQRVHQWKLAFTTRQQIIVKPQFRKFLELPNG